MTISKPELNPSIAISFWNMSRKVCLKSKKALFEKKNIVYYIHPDVVNQA